MDHPTRNAFLKDELRNILAALQVTNTNGMSVTLDGDPKAEAVADAYQKGFTDALRSMSIALGLVPIAAKVQAGVDPRRAWISSDSVQTEEDSWP
jgi:hypothetical protein